MNQEIKMKIRQIIPNTTPMWAVFRIKDEQYFYQPIAVLALCENKIIPIIGDESGEFIDPRINKQFVCFIYEKEELTTEKVESLKKES